MSLPQNDVRDKGDLSAIAPTSANHRRHTRAARLTGAGRSAVAVIGLRGPAAESALSACFRAASDRPWRADEIRFGHWIGCPDGQPSGATRGSGESVVVTQIDPQFFEIHCHGGPAATAAILADLARCNVEVINPQQWGELTARPLIVREASEVLVHCRTARTAAVALQQMRGGLRTWVESQIAQLACPPFELPRFHQQLAAIRSRGAFGIRLAKPFRVVLAGPVNVGKSSLVNAIVGYQRSITLDHHGTTRDVLHAETVIDGLPIRISDTAGFRVSDDVIERRGMSLAQATLADADLVVRVRQPGVEPSEVDALLGDFQAPVIDVLNKADLLDSQQADESGTQTLRTVATSGDGISELIAAIIHRLAADFPDPTDPIPLTHRQTELLAAVSGTSDRAAIRRQLHELIHGDYR